MPSLDPRHRLLAAVLDDEISIARRQEQLAEAERALRRRRRMLACKRLLPIPVALAAVIAFLVWRAPHPTPQPDTETRATMAKQQAAASIVGARESSVGIFVSTQEILETSPIPFVEVSTKQLHFTIQTISDRELLALLSDKGVMLLGSGPSRTLLLGRQGDIQKIR